MTSALELADVSVRYGTGSSAVDALRHVDLLVDAGEVIVVMGPSGSGKTTLLQIAGTLRTPTAGAVRVGGASVSGLSARELARIRARQIGFVFQNSNLISALSAEENVGFVASLGAGPSRPDAITELLALLGIADRARHRPGELSGGEQQRVAIARALVNDPDVVLADEPTGSLDSAAGLATLHLLERTTRSRGKALVIVTHDARIAKVADRVMWLEDGRLGTRRGESDMTVDPVCGMSFPMATAAAVRAVEGRPVYLCSDICAERFDRAPARYATVVVAGIPS
jgi:putative ABC transport system ATP-binding protein